MTKRAAAEFSRVLATGAAGLLFSTLLGGAACGSGELAPLQAPPETVKPKDPDPPPGIAPPPPVSGGTLLLTVDGKSAVAADPDRDSVWIVDLTMEKVRHRVRLSAGDEPGRLVEDQYGNVHVALRRGGKVVTIDPNSGTIVLSRKVCAAPRGIAYDKTSDNLHVACAGGELDTLKASGGDVARSLYLGADLRDVVVSGDHLLVSRFRSPELLELSASGDIVRNSKPRTTAGPATDRFGRPLYASPTQAYRMLASPEGAVMLHQRGLEGIPVSTAMPGGYGMGPCKGTGIASTAITLWGSDMQPGDGAMVMSTAAAVDVAVSRDGKQLAIVSASAATSQPIPGEPHNLDISPVVVLDRTQLAKHDPCTFPSLRLSPHADRAEYIAGAFDARGVLWLQSRQPARVDALLADRRIDIELTDAEDRTDVGHRLFHAVTSAGLACVSCHGEAGDDGHVWTFDPIGPRRTQSLRGGLLATAPFHWDGDMIDLSKLMREVFTGRMGGTALKPVEVEAIGRWLDAQPALPKSAPRDPQAVARGKTLFEDAALRCASCHSGPHRTSNQTSDVGTGLALQVPSLIDVAWRAPYLHNGCGKTLRDRFDPLCGGGDSHGKTSHLTSGQLDDLVTFLETL